jgi:hypothetical protein
VPNKQNNGQEQNEGTGNAEGGTGAEGGQQQPTGEQQSQQQSQQSQQSQQQEGSPAEGQEALGDPGKRALDAMKQERNAARDEARQVKDQLDALQAKVEGKEQEYQQQQREQQVKDEALSAANERILKSEIRALATGKLADPADALLHMDLSEFEVGSDGAVDGKKVGAAIDDLVTNKPYLAAQGGKKFQGSADGGTRKESAEGQLDQDSLKGKSPEQIVADLAGGRYDDLLSNKR